MKFNGFSLPGVYPLQGTVQKAMEHFFDDVTNPTYRFPPMGQSLDVSFTSTILTSDDLQSFVRENCDALFRLTS